MESRADSVDKLHFLRSLEHNGPAKNFKISASRFLLEDCSANMYGSNGAKIIIIASLVVMIWVESGSEYTQYREVHDKYISGSVIEQMTTFGSYFSTIGLILRL